MHTIQTINNWLVSTSEIGLIISLCWGVLAIFSSSLRAWLGVFLMFLSYEFGLVTFIQSAIAVFMYWHFFGLIVGLLFAGVGVVPLSLLATSLHGNWPLFGVIIVNIFLTFGTRGISILLVRNAGETRTVGDIHA